MSRGKRITIDVGPIKHRSFDNQYIRRVSAGLGHSIPAIAKQLAVCELNRDGESELERVNFPEDRALTIWRENGKRGRVFVRFTPSKSHYVCPGALLALGIRLKPGEVRWYRKVGA